MMHYHGTWNSAKTTDQTSLLATAQGFALRNACKQAVNASVTTVLTGYLEQLYLFEHATLCWV